MAEDVSLFKLNPEATYAKAAAEVARKLVRARLSENDRATPEFEAIYWSALSEVPAFVVNDARLSVESVQRLCSLVASLVLTSVALSQSPGQTPMGLEALLTQMERREITF